MANNQSFCELFGLLYQSYVIRSPENDELAAKTLDNDISLLLNDEQPLCRHVSYFLRNHHTILFKLLQQVATSDLLLHNYELWSMLDRHTQVRLFSTLYVTIEANNRNIQSSS